MALQKITFTQANVRAQYDADLYYFLLNDVGALKDIKDELSCSNSSNRIIFKNGYVAIYGRLIYIEENTSITIPLDTASYGYVIIEVNTNNNNVELTYKESTNQYPSLTQEDLSKGVGVYQFPIAAYTKTTTNLVLDSNFNLRFVPKKLRLSDLEEYIPMLGNKGKNKLLVGCKGSGYNNLGSTRYVYLATWDITSSTDNDSGIHLRGIIGGWEYATQSLIDVIANFRTGGNPTFNGYVSQIQNTMDIIITTNKKVYLVIPNGAYYNYTISIEVGTNGTIGYDGKLLESIDGTSVTNFNQSINVLLPYYPFNGGLKANKSTSTWGVQVGTEIASFNDSTGGSFKFRRDCPLYGQMSLIIDGNVYVNEGANKVLVASDVANKMEKDTTSITNAQGNWFLSEEGHIDFGTSNNQTRIYSSERPRYYKDGVEQGIFAMTSDLGADLYEHNIVISGFDGSSYSFKLYLQLIDTTGSAMDKDSVTSYFGRRTGAYIKCNGYYIDVSNNKRYVIQALNIVNRGTYLMQLLDINFILNSNTYLTNSQFENVEDRYAKIS